MVYNELTSVEEDKQQVPDMSCLNHLNRPGMPELKATKEQELLYQNFRCFDMNIDGHKIFVSGDKEALEGRFTGTCPVMLSYIGGGDTTNIPGFTPWTKPHHAHLFHPGMIIFTMYPALLPEHDYKGMKKVHDEFATCFEPRNFWKVGAKIKKLFPDMKANLQDKFHVYAESAGAAPAFYTLLTHGVNIVSIEFWYPMFGSLKIMVSLSKRCIIYRGEEVSFEQLVQNSLCWLHIASTVRPYHGPRPEITPPDRMVGSSVLGMVGTRFIIKGSLVWISLSDALTQRPSALEFASIVDSSHIYEDAGDEWDFHPDLRVDPQDISELLGDGLSNIKLRYLPEHHALEFIEERIVPRLHIPLLPLRVLIVQGTEDTKTPLKNAVSMTRFFERAGAEVRLEQVPGADHAFDAPDVEERTGKSYGLDYKALHDWSTDAMGWNKK